MAILDPKEVADTLDGWTGGDDFITKVFRFDDFAQAFAWMTRIAILDKDVTLAKAMEKAAS